MEYTGGFQAGFIAPGELVVLALLLSILSLNSLAKVCILV